jgi:tetratricopeptide (TPR) repeat protein
MSGQEFAQLVKKGITASNQGNTLDALFHFENAGRLGSTPTLNSYMGYCLARERQEFKEGIGLCRHALAKEPEQAVHYLNLGRVLLEAGRQQLAVEAFRQGLRRERHHLIVEELKKLSIRKPPVVPFLSHSHPVNKYLDLLLTRLRLR